MIRSFQWDLARQVERLGWLLEQLPKYADWGYQELHLHLEDAVEYPSVPGVARQDAYTYKEFERLVAAATRAGLNVVPIVNLLGHTQYLIKVPALRDLNELRAPDGSALPQGQLCPLHPRTLDIAEKLLRDVAPFCTAGKVHVGLDESFHLGKHPLSRKEIARVGLGAHFARYVVRLRDLTHTLGLRMGMWADMLCFIPEAIALLPTDIVAYDWYYFPFARLPRVELFNFRSYDLAKPLQARGIEYWGCPMNGSFRFEPLPLFSDRLGNIRSWWERCQRLSAGGMLMTSWEPFRLAIEMTTVVDAAAASLWLDPNHASNSELLARGFERALGVPRSTSKRLAAAAIACDRHPFAGYARWEINERWDCASPRNTSSDLVNGERFYRELARRPLPAPFRASAELLHYFYARDVFVRKASRAVLRLRRLHANKVSLVSHLDELMAEASSFGTLLRRGRRAARAMWTRTREPEAYSANAAILAADAARLRQWLKWLRQCRRRPKRATDASVVMGQWQLRMIVRNFAPALQKVVIEQQQADEAWREVESRFTLEFSAGAAMRRVNVDRDFCVSLQSQGGRVPRLRIGIRGVGSVKIGKVELTDGLVMRRPMRWQADRWRTLGRAAPRKGLPDLDWAANMSVLSLRFAQTPTPEKSASR